MVNLTFWNDCEWSDLDHDRIVAHFTEKVPQKDSDWIWLIILTKDSDRIWLLKKRIVQCFVVVISGDLTKQSQNIIANREHKNLWGVAKGWLIRILKLDFATVTDWIELGRVQQIRLEIQECERRRNVYNFCTIVSFFSRRKHFFVFFFCVKRNVFSVKLLLWQSLIFSVLIFRWPFWYFITAWVYDNDGTKGRGSQE